MNKEKIAASTVNAWPSPFHSGRRGFRRFSREGARLACETAVRSSIAHLERSPEFEKLLEQIGTGDGAQEERDAELLKQTRRAAYRILPQAALDANRNIRVILQRNGKPCGGNCNRFLRPGTRKSVGAPFWNGWISGPPGNHDDRTIAIVF